MILHEETLRRMGSMPDFGEWDDECAALDVAIAYCEHKDLAVFEEQVLSLTRGDRLRLAKFIRWTIFKTIN